MKAQIFLLIPLHFYYLENNKPGESFVDYISIGESTWVALIFSFFMLGCLLEPIEIVTKMGQSSFFRFWDKISYAQYMTHYLFFAITFRLYPMFLPVNFIGLILAILIVTIVPVPFSIMLNKYIELPAALL